MTDRLIDANGLVKAVRDAAETIGAAAERDAIIAEVERRIKHYNIVRDQPERSDVAAWKLDGRSSALADLLIFLRSRANA